MQPRLGVEEVRHSLCVRAVPAVLLAYDSCYAFYACPVLPLPQRRKLKRNCSAGLPSAIPPSFKLCRSRVRWCRRGWPLPAEACSRHCRLQLKRAAGIAWPAVATPACSQAQLAVQSRLPSTLSCVWVPCFAGAEPASLSSGHAGEVDPGTVTSCSISNRGPRGWDSSGSGGSGDAALAADTERLESAPLLGGRGSQLADGLRQRQGHAWV